MDIFSFLSKLEGRILPWTMKKDLIGGLRKEVWEESLWGKCFDNQEARIKHYLALDWTHWTSDNLIWQWARTLVTF